MYGASEAPALADGDRQIVELVRPVRTARADPTADNLYRPRGGVWTA